MREVVIVEAVRTPIGRGHPEKGIYKDTHPNELLGKACESLRAIDAVGDVHAPASYRQHLAVVLARRALKTAHSRMT